MLAVQEYLHNGKSLDDLKNELGISVYHHPELPLVGMKYCQIDSPKTHPVVRDCRGIVLEKDTWKVVAKPFGRFFNAGEVIEEYRQFNWNNFTCNTKEDGSLILAYYYAGEWHANTSGSFGLGVCQFSGKTWRQLFWDTAGIDKAHLMKHCTYIFELCTSFNKVVRTYPEPSVFLLSIFYNYTCEEMTSEQVYVEARLLDVPRPESYSFKSEDEIRHFLLSKEDSDKTFEGVIIRDDKGERWKIKTQTYVALHHLRGEGNNMFHPKHLLPFVLAGEGGELLAYFPEVEEAFGALKVKVDGYYDKLQEVWEASKHIESQKEFAQAIVGKTPFSSILFTIRKNGSDNLSEEWRNAHMIILKHI